MKLLISKRVKIFNICIDNSFRQNSKNLVWLFPSSTIISNNKIKIFKNIGSWLLRFAILRQIFTITGTFRYVTIANYKIECKLIQLDKSKICFSSVNNATEGAEQSGRMG